MTDKLIKTVVWLCVAVLTIASLMPVEMLPAQSFNIWDKAQHAFGFGWLALFGLLSYPQKPARVALLLLVYGGAIELAQAATGWRYGEWTDLAADGVGIVLGAMVWWLLRRTTRFAA